MGVVQDSRGKRNSDYSHLVRKLFMEERIQHRLDFTTANVS